MKKSVEIIGLPVISITEGKEFGSVKQLLIDYSQGTIAALVIDDGKWYLGAQLLPFAAVTGLGEYAVTINNSSELVAVADKPDYAQLFEADVKVIGTKVITKGGKIQGKINEFIIDDSGKIVTCEMETTGNELIQINAQQVVTFGKEVLIVADSDDIPTVAPIIPTIAEVPAVAPVQPEAVIEAEPETVPVIADTPAVQEVQVPETPETTIEVAPVVSEAVEAVEKEQAPVDDSAKKFDDKHRKFLLGKKVARRIETDNGMLIAEQGDEITEEVLQKAKLAGKFVELSMNIQ